MTYGVEHSKSFQRMFFFPKIYSAAFLVALFFAAGFFAVVDFLVAVFFVAGFLAEEVFLVAAFFVVDFLAEVVAFFLGAYSVCMGGERMTDM